MHIVKSHVKFTRISFDKFNFKWFEFLNLVQEKNFFMKIQCAHAWARWWKFHKPRGRFPIKGEKKTKYMCFLVCSGINCKIYHDRHVIVRANGNFSLLCFFPFFLIFILWAHLREKSPHNKVNIDLNEGRKKSCLETLKKEKQFEVNFLDIETRIRWV